MAFRASSSRLRRSSAIRGFSVRDPATGRARPADGRKASTTPARTTRPPARSARNSKSSRRSAWANSRTGKATQSAPSGEASAGESRRRRAHGSPATVAIPDPTAGVHPVAGRSARLVASARSPARKSTAGRAGSRASDAASPSRRRPATTVPVAPNGARSVAPLMGATTRK